MQSKIGTYPIDTLIVPFRGEEAPLEAFNHEENVSEGSNTEAMR